MLSWKYSQSENREEEDLTKTSQQPPWWLRKPTREYLTFPEGKIKFGKKCWQSILIGKKTCRPKGCVLSA